MKRRPALLTASLALAFLLASDAFGYYHFLHYRQVGGVWQSAPERFDLDALLDSTVYFYVSAEQRPRLQANDSFEGLVSQVRQALAVWDAPPSSALRVAFGGVLDGPLPGATPAGEIIFAELPPGVVGLGGPMIRDTERDGFMPILRSQVVISNDLVEGSRPRPSFSEVFYNTLVHEIGHALGLQHTLASSAMSTEVTRATSRAQPLGADDIAGLSALYPTDRFRRLTGMISGRVADASGQPVALASVAAVGPDGEVVTALSDPAGEYRIEGLAAGAYLLYAHPLPTATQTGLGPGNIVLPTDDGGLPIPASATFQAVFLGDRDSVELSPRVEVTAGQAVSGRDFQIRLREDAALGPVTTFSFPGNGAPGVHPAFLNLLEEPGLLVAFGKGLAEQARSLTVEALDRDIAVLPPVRYPVDERFVQLDFEAAPFSGLGPLNLLFRLPDYIQILPSAARLTSSAAPLINWITPDSSQAGAIQVWGENFDPSSQVYFDGLPGETLDFDAALNKIVVAPPPGPPGHRAVVTVYNPDGQSSAFTLPDGNVMVSYPEGPSPTVRLTPSSARPGSDFVVEVDGVFTQFVSGRTILGFGSSDITARTVDVISPERIRAVVSVSPEAAPGDYAVSVAHGLSTLILPGGFAVEAALTESAAPAVRYRSIVNSASNLPELSPGVWASLFGANLAQPGEEGAVSVTFDGLPALVFSATAGQINLQIPEALAPGFVEMRVFNGAEQGEPMLVEISRTSPGLFHAALSDGRLAGVDAPVSPGAGLELLATGLTRVAATDARSAMRVVVNGTRLEPASVAPLEDVPGLFRLQVAIPAAVAAGAGRLEVRLLADGRISNALELPVASAVAAVR